MGQLHVQRHRQQEVLLVSSKPCYRNYPATLDQAPSKAPYVHEQDLLLVTDAGLVTVIIGLAISLILIVIGSFHKKKIQL
jgi:hypothetical protein